MSLLLSKQSLPRFSGGRGKELVAIFNLLQPTLGSQIIYDPLMCKILLSKITKSHPMTSEVGKFWLAAIFLNKVLLEHSHVCQFVYCLVCGSFQATTVVMSSCDRALMACKPGILTIWPTGAISSKSKSSSSKLEQVQRRLLKCSYFLSEDP